MADNLNVLYKTSYDLEKLADGEVYMIFKKYDCDIDPQNVLFQLENLFNGNKVLGKVPEYEYELAESQYTNTLQLLTQKHATTYYSC